MGARQQQFSGVKPVDDKLAFDETALEAYLAERLAGFEGPLKVSQFKGGQSNPTYRLDAGGRAYVLRRKPPGKLLPSAHAVDREFRVVSALQRTGVPVARAHLLCEDESVIGTAFYVMDFVAGRVIWEGAMPGHGPRERAAHYAAMNAALAALHRVDHRAQGLGDFGREGGYVGRQIARWSKQYSASETENIPEMDRLIQWLPEAAPKAEETRLVHGDFRIDNMIFAESGPEILAILDWELATLGDPLADFTYHLMSWRMPPDLFNGLAGLDLQALGIPSEADYVASYCAATGREGLDHLDFYMAYNFFRLAAILQGITGRVRDGTAASEHAKEQAARVRPMAELAWAFAQAAR